MRKVRNMSKPIAIVVGAGSGLGQVTAITLATAGMTVVAVDRSEVKLKELPEGIYREVADASDPAVPGPLLDRIVTQIGPPDALVNTIGAYEPGDALSVTPQTFKDMIEVNLGAALWLTQATAPHMQQRGAGAIVHVTARFGLEPTAGSVAYGVAKAGLAHLTRILDLELRSSGIRVNAIAPHIISRQRAGAVAPEAIADVIAFLVSDAAAPVSGALLPVYG